jgi:hypothetical protein
MPSKLGIKVLLAASYRSDELVAAARIEKEFETSSS